MQAGLSFGASAMLRRRFIDRPLAILPSCRQQIFDVLHALETGAVDLRGAPLAFSESEAPRSSKPYDVVQGVAVVPVRGILVHELSLFGYWFGGETAYSTLAQMLVAAMSDPDVRAVALHVNSPGGEVAGCFDLVDGIYGLRGIKPIWAILDEEAYSAAYAIASAADKIVVPRTGGAGSIGVVTMHADVTAMLEKAGVKVTTVQYGARKTDRYATTPLSTEALERMQADVDSMGELFVATVARNRNLSAAKVRATEAGLFLGERGLEQGLVDAVLAPDRAFLSLLETLENT